ncbi:MAG: CAP domain-containing protein [Candidatus Moranbacteria bacterium]|nr:CAP domain-containing protein [Candidatus Moranbacteria bacterium]
MKKDLKRVAGQIGVSSKLQAEIFSVCLALLFFTAAGLSLSSMEVSSASDITVENIVNLTNKSRFDDGEASLKLNAKLSEAAREKAGDMVANNYFAHTSPAGKTPWVWIDGENYDYNFAGENLAMDFHSAESMQTAWMASPTHRANILNGKYKDVGVAMKDGMLSGHETTVVVVMFGSGDKNISEEPKTVSASIPQNKNSETSFDLPQLPAGEKRGKNIRFGSPFITSPASGEIISGQRITIQGRANPKEAVSVYDNKNLIAVVAADEDGWFSVEEGDLFSGNHQLSAAGEKDVSQTTVQFFVDQQKPVIDFHLFADGSAEGKYFLAVKSDKDNCFLDFNGEERSVNSGNEVLFPVDAKKSSAVVRVTDAAGNKNFKQVTLANFHFNPEKRKIEKAGSFASAAVNVGNLFSFDSGRRELGSHIGFGEPSFLAYGR